MNIKLQNLGPFGILCTPKTDKAHPETIDINFLKELLGKERLIVLRGFSGFHSGQEFASYCERWGEISVWPFGKVLELKEQNNPEDHIFDNNYVPLHWDGMYRPQVPEFQIFHCVEAPLSSQGGRTTFSDTVRALQNASIEKRRLWDQVQGIYQRKMEFYDSKTIAPIVDLHPYRGYSVIRYNEPPQAQIKEFLNPPTLGFTGIEPNLLPAFHAGLRESLYAEKNFYAHEWQRNDILIADNFSLLHGRESFESKAPRHLQRVHVLSQPALKNPHLVFHQ